MPETGRAARGDRGHSPSGSMSNASTRPSSLPSAIVSEDPQRAADVANAVSDAYLEEKLDARFESVRRASLWLQGRLTELSQKAVASDQLVQDYKREHGIIDTNAGQRAAAVGHAADRSVGAARRGAQGQRREDGALRADRAHDRNRQSRRLGGRFAGQPGDQRPAPAILAPLAAGGRRCPPLRRRARGGRPSQRARWRTSTA